jgi:hypothetical protein
VRLKGENGIPLDTVGPGRHNFTNYVCCECFGTIMGPLAREWCAGDWPKPQVKEADRGEEAEV